jgi:arsenate reductase
LKGVLFLCRENSCRSQIAEGLARELLPDGVGVFSAGSRPGNVNPRAVECLREIGVDISHHRSKSVDEIPAERVDCVITLCAAGEEDCPVFPGEVTRLHWPLPDPAAVEGDPKEIMAAFRRVRDEIAERIRRLRAELTPGD